MSGSNPIELNNFSKTYDHTSEGPVHAVEDISFCIESGERVGLLGANGAGKTTILKSILGLVKPTTGEIKINGYDVANNTKQAHKEMAAVLEGERNFYWRMTVLENMEFFAGIQGIDGRKHRSRHMDILEVLDMKEKANELTKNLSRGMQQKTAIACALARESPLLILDEPTLGLDVDISQTFRSEIDEIIGEDKTVLITSHDLSVIEDLCERVIIINNGSVILEDTVPSLTSMFDNTVVTITTETDSVEQLKRRLEGTFRVLDSSHTNEEVTFEVLLDDMGEIFVLMDLLETLDTVPLSVTTGEPDLESTFLRILNEDHREEIVQ